VPRLPYAKVAREASQSKETRREEKEDPMNWLRYHAEQNDGVIPAFMLAELAVRLADEQAEPPELDEFTRRRCEKWVDERDEENRREAGNEIHDQT